MIEINNSASIVVHGGAGSRPQDAPGCTAAADAARQTLLRGEPALAAAVAAISAMEDDGRFNAGSGAIVGLDGATIEMDAAVMDTRGALGAVACIQRVKNPVQVARDVAASPHRMLCGEGALRFARVGGHADYYSPSPQALAAHRALADALGPDAGPFGMLWNYERPPLAGARQPCDTVGAVVRCADGHFAVAASTGGSAPSLLGRVGDTPIVGSGFYAGTLGAITVTGKGEKIIPHMLAHTVYAWLLQGLHLDQALRRGLELFGADDNIGIIAITASQAGAASTREMPFTML